MLQKIRDAVLIVFVSILCLISWQAWRVLLQVEQTVSQVGERAEATLTDARRVLLSVGGTAAQVRKTAEEQRALFAESTKRTNTLIARLDATVQHFDENVNGQLLPAATAMLRHQDENATRAVNESIFALRGMTMDVHQTVTELQPTLENLAQASAGAAGVMNDPHLGTTLAAIDGSAKNVEAATGDVKDAIHRATRPASLAWLAIKTSFDVVTKVFTAFVK